MTASSDLVILPRSLCNFILYKTTNLEPPHRDQMRVAFFQAAMLVAATVATESPEESSAPDFLVQTASLIDYFYPETPEEILA